MLVSESPTPQTEGIVSESLSDWVLYSSCKTKKLSVAQLAVHYLPGACVSRTWTLATDFLSMRARFGRTLYLVGAVVLTCKKVIKNIYKSLLRIKILKLLFESGLTDSILYYNYVLRLKKSRTRVKKITFLVCCICDLKLGQRRT